MKSLVENIFYILFGVVIAMSIFMTCMGETSLMDLIYDIM